MDNQEYLNQISSANRPAKAGGGGILSSGIAKIGAALLGLAVLIIIVGSFLGGGNTLTDQIYGLKLRVNGTMEAISEYQPRVKSSLLRSSTASLYGVLSSVSLDLDNYLTEKKNFNEKNANKKVTEEVEADMEDLNSELFNARINGILDRVFAHKMAYAISVISSKESSLLNSTKDEDLKLSLDKSLTNLDNLYNNFNDFTEGTK